MKSRRVLAREAARRHVLAKKRSFERFFVGLQPNSAEPARRFVLVFHARSGSNMLRSALNTHPNIRCEREVFRNRHESAAGRPVYPASKKINRLLVDYPEVFLERELFGQQPKFVHARGFKLAFGHAREPEWESVWGYLAEERIHVIQLERQNLLAAFLSQERARRSGSFVARRPNEPSCPVSVDPARCIEYFEAVRRREREAQAVLGRCPRIIVTYEKLAADPTNVLNGVQDFLGISPLPLAPQTARQSTWDPTGQLLNFSDLEAAFKHTPYARYLVPGGQL